MGKEIKKIVSDGSGSLSRKDREITWVKWYLHCKFKMESEFFTWTWKPNKKTFHFGVCNSQTKSINKSCINAI